MVRPLNAQHRARLVLAVLGDLADVERDLIRTRAAEGGSRAKLRGKHMVRPLCLTPAQQKGHQTAPQGATLQELAGSYDRSISTMRRAPAPRNPLGSRCYAARCQVIIDGAK